MREGQRLIAILICVFALAWATRKAHAAFDGSNTEHFLGNLLDTSTWEVYPQAAVDYGAISQNYALSIDTTGPFTIADYTTKTVQVPIGGSVKVTVNAGSFTGLGGGVWLYLTDNSNGSAMQTNWDQKQIIMYMPSAGGNIYGGAGSNGSGYGFTVAENVPTNTPFVWSIERFSASSGRFTVRTTGGQLVGSYTATNLTWPNVSFNTPLYISLQTSGASATFSDVVYQLPEPAGLTVIAMSLGLLVSRRSR